MNAQDASPLRLDRLYRIAASLLTAAGVKPERASALAWHRLWFDAAGLPDHGLALVPLLLDQIARGEVEPRAEGKVLHERGATAVFDGKNGPSTLALARAAEIAVEKAREFGTGLVHVRGIAPTTSAAPVVSDIAIGPMVGTAVGPEGAWTVAIPASMTQPLLHDALFGEAKAGPTFAPWSPFTLDGEWAVQATSVKAIEPLESLHARVARCLAASGDGRFSHEKLESGRRAAHEQGLTIEPTLIDLLRGHSERLGVPIAF